MPYVELEQFLDRGSIRLWWGFSLRTFVGCVGGGVLSQQLGSVLFGAGTFGMAALTLLGAALGITMLSKRRGIVVVHRLLVLIMFAFHTLNRRGFIDGASLGGNIELDEGIPIRVRVGTVEKSGMLGSVGDLDDPELGDDLGESHSSRCVPQIGNLT